MITIDYLIINLKGELLPQDPVNNKLKVENPFTFEKQEFGTKIFTNLFKVFYKDTKIGVLSTSPRSAVIDPLLSQLQIENHLFYTLPSGGLRKIIADFCDTYKLEFSNINRLDIAHDSPTLKENVQTFVSQWHDEKLILSGRKKKVVIHYETEKGKRKFQGITIGSRSASRYLRIYDKSLEMIDKPKPYITAWHETLGYLPTDQVYRFEYQLNALFFRNLFESQKTTVTWQIFELATLLELIRKAEKNHFEICFNTGKSETNKEKKFILVGWSKVAERLNVAVKDVLQRIYKPFEVSLNIQKRLCKSILREIYLTKHEHWYYTLVSVLKSYDLKDWFVSKSDFYFTEFKDKEKYKNHFSIQNHNEILHSTYLEYAE